MEEAVGREREHDFTLVLRGVNELTQEVTDALFEAGCDDATASLRFGVVHLTFSRSATTIKDAILSAMRDVRRSGVGDVQRVDVCDLVTQSDIARRIGRTRQAVNQYIAGTRGPGGFPPPSCHITDGAPLWMWCEVAYWLRQNNMIREEELLDAQQLALINVILDYKHMRQIEPAMAEEILREISSDPADHLA